MKSRDIVRRGRAALAVCLLATVGLIASCECPDQRRAANRNLDPTVAGEMTPGHSRLKERGKAFELRHFHVRSGSEDLAKLYYRSIVSPQLQFLTPETIEASTINDLLNYFGYADVTAKDLHRLSSADLMALHDRGDILATRFFAPKITQVADTPTEVPALGFGWRKLIRLKPKTGSKALENGVGMLLFLQNIFEKSVDGDPFAAERSFSSFNQAIITRKEGPFDEKDAAYFLTYGALIKIDDQGRPVKNGNDFQDDGKIIFSLKATFDSRSPLPGTDAETGLEAKDYFVPDSCVQCHGGDVAVSKANYLDTDHWFDRVTPNYGLTDDKYKREDFTALGASPNGVIYDGGKDTTKPQFQLAFAVIRTLNEEIRDQNRLVDGGPENFQLAAVEKWLSVHEPGPAGAVHVPPYRRGFGSPTWEPDNENHRKLLYYFNRYCYRCHSSVRYNVFDLNAVEGKVRQIPGRLKNVVSSRVWMPQDRIFPGLVPSGSTGVATGDLKEFLDLLALLNPPR